jgi:hypothetical protein
MPAGDAESLAGIAMSGPALWKPRSWPAPKNLASWTVGRYARRVATMEGDVETYYSEADGKWRNMIKGNVNASNVFDTKAEAVRVGRQMAMMRKVEHIICKMDGTIGERNSYGE